MCVCVFCSEKAFALATMLCVLWLAPFVGWLIGWFVHFSLVHMYEAMPRHEKKSIFTTSTNHTTPSAYNEVAAAAAQKYCTEYHPPTNYVTSNNQFGSKPCFQRCCLCDNGTDRAKKTAF